MKITKLTYEEWKKEREAAQRERRFYQCPVCLNYIHYTSEKLHKCNDNLEVGE